MASGSDFHTPSSPILLLLWLLLLILLLLLLHLRRATCPVPLRQRPVRIELRYISRIIRDLLLRGALLLGLLLGTRQIAIAAPTDRRSRGHLLPKRTGRLVPPRRRGAPASSAPEIPNPFPKSDSIPRQDYLR